MTYITPISPEAPETLLHYAIHKLHELNPKDEDVTELYEDWEWWRKGWAMIIPEPTPLWWAALQYYHLRYGWNFADAKVKPKESEYQPKNIDPTVPRIIKSQVDKYVDTWQQTGTKAIHEAAKAVSTTADAAIDKGANKILPSLGPWILGGFAVYIVANKLMGDRR